MELLPWLTAIGHLQDAAMLLAFIIFMITPKPGKKNFIVIGIILGFGFVVEIVTWLSYAVFHKNPNYFGVIRDYLLVVAFFFFYKPKIQSKNIINIFKIVVVVYIILALLNAIFYQKPNMLASYTYAMQSAVLIGFSVTYFFILRKELPRQVYIALPIFWINLAVIVYYSVMLPIYLITDYIYITLKLSIIPLWMVHNSVGVLYYIFLAIGLWRNRSLYIRQSSRKE